MSLVMTSPPAVEPVTVAEAKAHMRIDTDAEDILIGSLVLTSRLHIETALSLALITQSWKFTLDRWPKSREIELPLAPLRSVGSVHVIDASGNATTVSDQSYLVDLASRPPRLIWNNSVPPLPGRAAKGIEIDLTAGFGDSAAGVPAPLKHAIPMLAAHRDEPRDPPGSGQDGGRIPDAAHDPTNPSR